MRLYLGIHIPEPDGDGNYGAVYLGGNIDPTTIQINDDELFKTVVHGVTNYVKVLTLMLHWTMGVVGGS